MMALRPMTNAAALLLAGALCLAAQTAGAQPAPAPTPQPAAAQAAPAQRARTGTGLAFTAGPTIQKVESGPWKGKRVAGGQPDVEGWWSNTVANHNNFTDPQGGIPNDPAARNRPQKPRNERAPSRVSDPADGQIPFQDWAAQRVKEFQANFNNPTEPQYIEPLARCAPGGVPKTFIWHGYEIRQYPGYVLFLFNSGYRLIQLDGKPHLPVSIKLWNADSRGHWEGNTLVVDVSNSNSKALFGRSGEFASENVHVTERYVFDNDGQRYNYVATFEDPTVYTRPWTATIPAQRHTDKEPYSEWHYEAHPANTPDGKLLHEAYERICYENNGGFGLGGGAPVAPAVRTAVPASATGAAR
jgi:hypothetical protein